MSKKRCLSCGEPVEDTPLKCSDCGNRVCRDCYVTSEGRCKECIEFEKMKNELKQESEEGKSAGEYEDPSLDMFPDKEEEKSDSKAENETEKAEKEVQGSRKSDSEKDNPGDESAGGFHIIEIDIQNNKRIKAFYKVLDGEDLIVAGDTGIGKTTAITALWTVLEKADDQIKHGEERAKIKVKLSDGSKTMVCKREYYMSGEEEKSRIKITDSEGERVSVKDFKKLLSDLSVNPHLIAEMTPLERTNTLIKSAGIEEDIRNIDEELESAKEERTFLNRKRKETEPGPEPEKVEPVNIKEKSEKLQKRMDYNSQIKEDRSFLEAKKDGIETLKEKISKLKKELREAQETLDRETDKYKDLSEELEGKDILDLSDLKQEIEEAEERNRKASEWSTWKKQQAEHEKTRDQYQNIKEQISSFRKKKKKLLEEADFPLEGLNIEDGEIYYKGVKFENLGKSERILVSSGLAKEQIGKIRVVRIDGIESMSREDFNALRDLFKGANIQILASRVSRGELEPNEITIEEGEFVEDKDNG